MSTERPARRSARGDGLFVLGLVGRAGSGKSTVARALQADGAALIEADRIGHEVTEQDRDVRAELAREYGPGVYRDDGTLDRARVAERVFRDPAARARLDRWVHPRIVERIHARLDDLRARGHRGVVVLDAALLLEWGLERDCDAVLAVTAPEALQLARLARQRGWSAEEARARHRAQRTDRAYAVAADAVIENRGGIEELEQAARAAVARLRARGAGAGRAREGERC
jgi:dephospho-CoA kinase